MAQLARVLLAVLVAGPATHLASQGSGWIPQPAPGPGGGPDLAFGIAGRSAADVWLVGSSDPQRIGPRHTLAVHWDGTRWAAVPTPSPSITWNVLSDVVALPDGTALAVGEFKPATIGQSLALHWDRQSWRVVATPQTSGGSTFHSAALSPTGTVWVGGTQVDPGRTGATLTRWKGGGSWGTEVAPNVGVFRNRFYGVSALSDTEVYCVGTQSDAYGSFHVLLQRYDGGSSWTTFPVPTPGGSGSLEGVVALSSTDVWAVGHHRSPTLNITQPLILRFDGAVWRQWPLPDFPEGSCELRAVTALAADEVFASGTYALPDGTPRAFVLRWNGRGWARVALPPSGGSHEWFRAMHVTADGTAWAAGQYSDGTRTEPIGYRLDGAAARWSSYGAGNNPPGSLTVVAGRPAPGAIVTVGVDNPLGTQAAGALPFLVLGLVPDARYPAGLVLPGTGMGGPGAPGELLVAPPLAVLAGPPWTGAGRPAPFPLPIPNDPRLYGVRVYGQGLLQDAGGSVPVGLTDGLELVLGR